MNPPPCVTLFNFPVVYTLRRKQEILALLYMLYRLASFLCFQYIQFWYLGDAIVEAGGLTDLVMCVTSGRPRVDTRVVVPD